MQNIIKRLEIILASIFLEDEETINLQFLRLKKINNNNDVKGIIDDLQSGNYRDAVDKIEDYLSRHSGVVEYIDTELQALKLELKILEAKLQNLLEEKFECLNDINEFNTQYNIRLGDLLKSILSLKKEILFKQAEKQQQKKEKYIEDIKTFEETKETIEEIKQTIEELESILGTIDKNDDSYDEIFKEYRNLKEELSNLEEELFKQEAEIGKTEEFIDDERIQEEYEEAKAQYEEFDSEYENIKDIEENTFDLNEGEKTDLKLLYYKAIKLSHPDTASEEHKEQANEVMKQLNDAYKKKDINKLRKILASLENGYGLALEADKFNNKEFLKEKVEEYKNNIRGIEEELDDIKDNETYRLITGLDNWDEYFEDIKKQLQMELDRLKETIQDNEKEKEIEDDYWESEF